MDALTSEAEKLLSPLCRDLRSKKYYFLKSIPVSADDIMDAANHCWCCRTSQVVGPDDDFVHPKDCAPGRSCYRSAFE